MIWLDHSLHLQQLFPFWKDSELWLVRVYSFGCLKTIQGKNGLLGWMVVDQNVCLWCSLPIDKRLPSHPRNVPQPSTKPKQHALAQVLLFEFDHSSWPEMVG